MKKIVYIWGILIMFLMTSCYNYNGWYETDIPTKTQYLGKIKIPNGWEFKNENNLVFLKNKSTQSIVAEEIYRGYETHITDNFELEDGWNYLEFNNNINLDIKNKENYHYINLDNITLYDDGKIQKYCMIVNIMRHSIKGAYLLAMMFSDDVELETIKQMRESSKFGGFVQG